MLPTSSSRSVAAAHDSLLQQQQQSGQKQARKGKLVIVQELRMLWKHSGAVQWHQLSLAWV
jgi:hypothetical protein